MPNPNNRVRGEQWDTCDRCGFPYPVSALAKQKGLLVCTRTCVDNLEVERRPRQIEQVLGTGENFEGADTRQFDRSYFDGFDQELG